MFLIQAQSIPFNPSYFSKLGLPYFLKPKPSLWPIIGLLFRPEPDLLKARYGLLACLKAYIL